MSPELQNLFDHGKQLGDAIRILAASRVECLAFSGYGWTRVDHAKEYLVKQAAENDAQIAAYFSPEVAA